MNELIKIEIVTPLELLKSKETKMSVLPGSEGELGIMSKHTPLMTLLNRGIIKLFDENNSVTDQIAVDGGVADVSEEGITVLSERAEVLGSNASNKQIINNHTANPQLDRVSCCTASIWTVHPQCSYPCPPLHVS